MKKWKAFLGISIVSGLCLGTIPLYAQDYPFSKSEIKFFNVGEGCSGCPPASKEQSGITLLGFVTVDSPHTDQAIESIINFRQKHPEVEVGTILVASVKKLKDSVPKYSKDQRMAPEDLESWRNILMFAKKRGKVAMVKPGETVQQRLSHEMEQGKQYWETNLPLYVDFRLSYVRAYNITAIPTFVFKDNNNRAYKIAGQPNLEEIYKKYLKEVKKDEKSQSK